MRHCTEEDDILILRSFEDDLDADEARVLAERLIAERALARRVARLARQETALRELGPLARFEKRVSHSKAGKPLPAAFPWLVVAAVAAFLAVFAGINMRMAPEEMAKKRPDDEFAGREKPRAFAVSSNEIRRRLLRHVEIVKGRSPNPLHDLSASIERLAEAGAPAVEDVRALIGERVAEIRKEKILDEATITRMESDDLLEGFPVGMRIDAAGWHPDQIDGRQLGSAESELVTDLLVLSMTRRELELRQAWTSGRPVLYFDWFAIRSFEHFADGGRWDRARLCIASGTETEAAGFHRLLQEARRTTQLPLSWQTYRNEVLHLLVLTTAPEARPSLDTLRFEGAVALARMVKPKGGADYVILNMLEGDLWK